MNSANMKVMTVRLDKTVVDDLGELLRELGLRRDDYLRTRLPYEVNLLSELSPNPEIALAYLQSRMQRQRSPRTKLGLKLPESLVQQINEVCTEKKVPRDFFVETFFRYLAYGWPERGAQSPLVMAADYLRDPYRDVEGQATIYEQRCCLAESTVKVLRGLDALVYASGSDDGPENTK